MNKVNKAIIMAAGIGNRLRPITSKTPKPLIEVNGKRMIEGIIEALFSRGIRDIVIVVGYLSEKFEYLKDKYDVRLIYNADYMSANNIASLYYARGELGGSLVILDGDQIICDSKIIKKQFAHSGYACWYSDRYSEEWMLHLDGKSLITDCSRTGGSKAWELKSLSYWTSQDSAKLADFVKCEYESGNRQIYWDDVAMFAHRSQFDLYGHKIKKDDIIEIDSIDDLISVDKSYSCLKEAETC